MCKRNASVWILIFSAFIFSGCLESGADTVDTDDGGTAGGGGDTGGGGSGGGGSGGGGSGGGGSGGGGSGGGGNPPPPPPVDTLDTIPAVTFDYMKEPGATTSSGSLPSTIGAGEVLAFGDQTATLDESLNCQGTEQNPAFIVGGKLSGANDTFTITGSWCYFIDTEFVAMQPRPNGDHMVFRNVDIHGSTAKNGMNISGSNIVITGSEIHHNQRTGNEAHGIQVAQGADTVWILGNSFHHNSGDGLQGCHGCSANPPKNVYIGANTFYADRENAVDFKWIENVIVEGNVMYNYVSAQSGVEWCFDDGSACGTWNSGSDGSAVVIGSDGTPNGVLIKDNEIYSAVNAVRVEEGVGIEVIGNNIYDITRQCLQLDKEGENLLYQDNTCTNAGRGIFQNWRENFSLIVDDNVFENISGPAIEYESRGVCDASTLTSNQFSSSGSIICGNTVAADTAGVNSLPGASGNVVN